MGKTPAEATIATAAEVMVEAIAELAVVTPVVAPRVALLVAPAAGAPAEAQAAAALSTSEIHTLFQLCLSQPEPESLGKLSADPGLSCLFDGSSQTKHRAFHWPQGLPPIPLSWDWTYTVTLLSSSKIHEVENEIESIDVSWCFIALFICYARCFRLRTQ